MNPSLLLQLDAIYARYCDAVLAADDTFPVPPPQPQAPVSYLCLATVDGAEVRS